MSSIIQMISSKHFQVEQLANGVYAVIHRAGGLAVANACIVNMGNQALVFDTLLTPQAAIDLNLAAEALTDQTVTLVVNSHYHSDHTWGNQAFAPDADLISSEGTRRMLISNAIDDYRWYKENLGDHYPGSSMGATVWTAQPRVEIDAVLEKSFTQGIQEALPRLRFRHPNLTFEKSLTLHGSDRTVQLISFNGGHTLSDAVLWIPDERILAAGDLLYTGAHPYQLEADPRQTINVLDQIAALEPKFIVPGHGPVGTSRDLLIMQGYLTAMISKAEELARREQPLAAARRAKIPAAYQVWQLGSNYTASLRRMVLQVARENGLELVTPTQDVLDHIVI